MASWPKTTLRVYLASTEHWTKIAQVAWQHKTLERIGGKGVGGSWGGCKPCRPARLTEPKLSSQPNFCV